QKPRAKHEPQISWPLAPSPVERLPILEEFFCAESAYLRPRLDSRRAGGRVLFERRLCEGHGNRYLGPGREVLQPMAQATAANVQNASRATRPGGRECFQDDERDSSLPITQ